MAGFGFLYDSRFALLGSGFVWFSVRLGGRLILILSDFPYDSVVAWFWFCLVFRTTRWSLGSGFVWHDSAVAWFSGFRCLVRGDFSFVFSTSLSGNNVTESSAGLRCLTPPDRIEGGSGNAASVRHFDFVSVRGGIGQSGCCGD